MGEEGQGIGGQGWVGVGVGSWGPNTGCKALAKSNMALFVFAGRTPSVCFWPVCPRRLPVHRARKLFSATPFLYPEVSSVGRRYKECWGKLPTPQLVK